MTAAATCAGHPRGLGALTLRGLLDGLVREGRVPLAYAVAGDAWLLDAWQAGTDERPMLALGARGWPRRRLDLAAFFWAQGRRHHGCQPPCARCAARLAGAYPPPTLAELLAWRQS